MLSESIKTLKDIAEKRNVSKNSTEELKANTDFLEAYEKIKTYAKDGYDSIESETKKYVLKNFGIFDRPSTPKQFMMRIRVPFGKLSKEQAVTIGALAKEYGKDYIDITTRMQVELRFLDIKNIPMIIEKLDSIGLTPFQTGVDNFRNILTDPLDAKAKDSIIECKPLVKQMQDIFLKNTDWISTLPRKFNTGISGSLTNRCNIFGQDCAFILAKKNDEYGFNLYLGGKVGKSAKCANMFVKTNEVALVFKTIIELFKEYGFRDNRNKNRLYFLLESVGISVFANAIREKANKKILEAGELCNSGQDFETKGALELKDGSYAIHAAVPSGIFSGSKLIELANLTDENYELCFTVEQNIYLIGIKNPNDIKHDMIEYKNNFLSNIVACAGSGFCPFGVIENKPDAIKLAEYLNTNVEFSKPLRMCWSACPKGCGIHGAGDIGFVGTKKAVDGKIELAVDVYVGAELHNEGKEAHLCAKGILLTELNEFVAKMLK